MDYCSSTQQAALAAVHTGVQTQELEHLPKPIFVVGEGFCLNQQSTNSQIPAKGVLEDLSFKTYSPMLRGPRGTSLTMTMRNKLVWAPHP